MTTGAYGYCSYWNCNKPVRKEGYALCYKHWKSMQDGLIDQCPRCGIHYKETAYYLCDQCFSQENPIIFKKLVFQTLIRSNKRFFIYILKLENGAFYIGQTDSLRERLSEHRDGKTKSTANRNPKLQYFEVLLTREDAEAREKELKKTLRFNPRKIRSMIIVFQDNVSALDFD